MEIFKKRRKLEESAENGRAALKKQIKGLYSEINRAVAEAKEMLNGANELLEMLAAGSVETGANLKDLRNYEEFTAQKLNAITAAGSVAAIGEVVE